MASSRWRAIIGINVLLAFALVVKCSAQSEKHRNGGNLRRPLNEQGVAWAKRVQQGYSMKLWLSNQMAMGIEAWDPYGVPPNECSNGGIGLEYPVGACIEHLFGAAPWIGGIVNGERRVSEGYNGDDARMEFLPERRDTARDKIWQTRAGSEEYHPKGDGYSGYYYVKGLPVNQRGADDDGDGKADEDELDGLDNDGDWNPLTDDLGADGLPDGLEVSCDGNSYDPLTNPDPAFDNYDTTAFDRCHFDQDGNFARKRDKNRYTEHNGIPDHGEPHVDEDYGAVSDNDFYFSATDTFKSPAISGHKPLGIKVLVKSFAWKGDDGEAILPFDYYFINVGKNIISNVYVGFFADPDVGPVNVSEYFRHNYACYIPELRTAYVHNPIDRGATPLGLTLLGAPRPLDSLKYVFWWHSLPNIFYGDSIMYSVMSGEAFPTQLIPPCQPSNSFTDTRFFFFVGPFQTMNPGDTLRISVALVSGDRVDEGANSLRANAARALQMRSREYHPRPAPPSPPLRIWTQNNKVHLDWTWHSNDPTMNPLDSWDEYDNVLDGLPDTNWRKQQSGEHRYGGRNFEGYRLWRSESPAYDEKSFTMLAQYNLDPDPIWGTSSGLRTTYIDSNLRRGNTYWYSVTSYSVPGGFVVRIPDSVGQIVSDTLYTSSAESELRDNARQVHLSYGPATQVGKVRVVPNPYRGDAYYTDGDGYEGHELEWTEYARTIWFIDLPERATIRVFSLAGDVIATIEHDDALRAASGLPVGQEEWKLFSESERALASGLYIFSVESAFGRQVGKFAVIK